MKILKTSIGRMQPTVQFKGAKQQELGRHSGYFQTHCISRAEVLGVPTRRTTVHKHRHRRIYVVTIRTILVLVVHYAHLSFVTGELVGDGPISSYSSVCPVYAFLASTWGNSFALSLSSESNVVPWVGAAAGPNKRGQGLLPSQ